MPNHSAFRKRKSDRRRDDLCAGGLRIPARLSFRTLLSGIPQGRNQHKWSYSFPPSCSMMFPQPFRSALLRQSPIAWFTTACSPPAGFFWFELCEAGTFQVKRIPSLLQLIAFLGSNAPPRRTGKEPPRRPNFTPVFVEQRYAAVITNAPWVHLRNTILKAG